MPAKRVRTHLLNLHAHGITYAYIVRQTGLSWTTIQQVRRGTYKRCHINTATAIMNIKGPR